MLEWVLTIILLVSAGFGCICALHAIETLFNCIDSSDRKFCFQKFAVLMTGFVIFIGVALVTVMVIGDLFLWA